jgi:DNA repair protein RadC
MRELKHRSDRSDGHRRRLQQRFLKGGLQGFLDHEIVELLLTLGTPRKDCKRPAKKAMQRFKMLRCVLEASENELQEIEGIGPRNIFGIKLVQEVARRFLRERMMSRPVCHSSREVFDYLYHTLRDAKKEKFKAIFLNAKNQIIEEETFFEGTVDTSAVYPREILKNALRHDASAVIFVHNHPSGDPEPSESDREITKELVFASSTMQMKVHGLIEDYEFLFQDLKRRIQS